MYKELNQHKKADTVKWVITFILIVIFLLGMIGSCAVILKDKDNTNEVKQPYSDTVVTDGEGNEMVSGEVYAMPANMIFSATSSEPTNASEGIKLNATVYPETADNKAVDWVVAFVNPSSAWASGKNVSDYVKAVPESDGAAVATVECLQAFGERIKITVTSRANPLAKAECVLDYARRILDTAVYSIAKGYLVGFGSNEVLIDMVNLDYDTVLSKIKDKSIWSDNYENLLLYEEDIIASEIDHEDPEQKWADKAVSRTFKFSDYTIKDCMLVYPEGSEYGVDPKLKMEIADGFEVLVDYFFQKCNGTGMPLTSVPFGYYVGGNPIEIAIKMLKNQNIGAINETIYVDVLGRMVQWIKDNPDTPIITYTLTYEGKYSTYSKQFTVRFNPDTVEMPVFDLSLDKSEIVI